MYKFIGAMKRALIFTLVASVLSSPQLFSAFAEEGDVPNEEPTTGNVSYEEPTIGGDPEEPATDVSEPVDTPTDDEPATDWDEPADTPTDDEPDEPVNSYEPPVVSVDDDPYYEDPYYENDNDYENDPNYYNNSSDFASTRSDYLTSSFKVPAAIRTDKPVNGSSANSDKNTSATSSKTASSQTGIKTVAQKLRDRIWIAVILLIAGVFILFYVNFIAYNKKRRTKRISRGVYQPSKSKYKSKPGQRANRRSTRK